MKQETISPTKYQHKPTEVMAIQYEDTVPSRAAISSFSSGLCIPDPLYRPIVFKMRKGDKVVQAMVGDYVVKLETGEIVFITKEEFEAAYTPVEAPKTAAPKAVKEKYNPAALPRRKRK